MNSSLSTRRLAGAAAFVFAFALLGVPSLKAQATDSDAAAANPCAAKSMNPCAAKADEMDKWMAQMAMTLDLSDEQVAEVKPIMLASHEKSQEIMAKYDGEKTDAAKKEMKALQTSTMEELGAVLNEDQMKKLHGMMTSDAEHAKEMSSGSGH